MSHVIDILFITQIQRPRDAGAPDVYRPLRFELQGQPASLPALRLLARGVDPAAAQQELVRQQVAAGIPPVLTPFYLEDFMARRGIALTSVPCLETGWEDVRAALAQGVGIIALSTTWLPGSLGAETVRAAAVRLRALAPGVLLVAGGVAVRKGLRARELLAAGQLPGVTQEQLARDYLLIDARQDSAFDALAVGEGSEAALADLALRVREGREYRDVPNLVFPSADGYASSPTVADQSDVDGETVDWRRHRDRIRFFEAPVRTGVGCPFRCEFCDFSGLYRQRSRSEASLVAELRTLAAALPAPRRVFFTDDNIALSRQRLIRFAQALRAADLGLAWRAFCRADAIDDEVAGLLRESGCVECLLGLESGDPEILRNMNKRLDLDRAREAIARLDREGIRTQCTFVVGFPGECARSVERTAQFISALPSGAAARAFHRYYLFRFELAPLCPASSPESRARFGLTGLGEQWAHRTMNVDEAREAVREIFLRVQGPTHMYLEPIPTEWPAAATRRVLEFREALQKDRVQGRARPDGLPQLLACVQAAERDAAR